MEILKNMFVSYGLRHLVVTASLLLCLNLCGNQQASAEDSAPLKNEWRSRNSSRVENTQPRQSIPVKKTADQKNSVVVPQENQLQSHSIAAPLSVERLNDVSDVKKSKHASAEEDLNGFPLFETLSEIEDHGAHNESSYSDQDSLPSKTLEVKSQTTELSNESSEDSRDLSVMTEPHQTQENTVVNEAIVCRKCLPKNVPHMNSCHSCTVWWKPWTWCGSGIFQRSSGDTQGLCGRSFSCGESGCGSRCWESFSESNNCPDQCDACANWLNPSTTYAPVHSHASGHGRPARQLVKTMVYPEPLERAPWQLPPGHPYRSMVQGTTHSRPCQNCQP